MNQDAMTPKVRETVLSLIPHENHRRLAEMLMDGKTDEEIKLFGFDDLQIEKYRGLILSVVDNETPLKPEVVEPSAQPEEVKTPEETQPTAPVSTSGEETKENEQQEATQPSEELKEGDGIPA